MRHPLKSSLSSQACLGLCIYRIFGRMACLVALLALCFLAPGGATANSKGSTSKGSQKPDYFKSLMDESFEEIVRRYAFIGDLNQKPAERSISSEIFWKYTLKVPSPKFAVPSEIDSLEKSIPATKGVGKGLEFLNQARVHLFDGDYQAAADSLMVAKDTLNSSEFINRRIYYFLGVTYLKMATQTAEKLGSDNPAVEKMYGNVLKFLGSAYRPPMNIKDEVLDQYTPKVFYILASIYHRNGEFGDAYQAASEGLSYLQDKNLKTYKHRMRRMVAESFILNKSYSDAVQEIDMAIREDPEPEQVASDFARVADIYYGLNNYERAEDIYGLSIAIDRRLNKISAVQAMLRGEALFWLGRFDESEASLEYAVRGGLRKNTKELIDEESYKLAKLRIADIYLHRSSVMTGKARDEVLEKAKLKYFQISQAYAGSEAAAIAQLRLSCLELPFYQGYNVSHARKYLETIEDNFSFSPHARELAMACLVGSYAKRERSTNMLSKVQKFASKYPRSRFLAEMLEPVKETKAMQLTKLFKQGDDDRAISYFEDNRATLFDKNISDYDQFKLFSTYFERGDITRALPFWPTYKDYYESQNGAKLSDAEAFKRIVFLEEITKLGTNFPEKVSEKVPEKVSENTTKHEGALLPPRTSNELSALYLDLKKRVDFNYLSMDKFLATRLKLADTDGSSVRLFVSAFLGLETDQIKDELLCGDFISTVSSFASSHAFKVDGESEGSEGSEGSEVGASGDMSLQKITDKTSEIVKRSYRNLSAKNNACAKELLGLEFKVHDKNGSKKQLAETWLKRLDWPVDKSVAEHIWQAAEFFSSSNDRENAVKAWTHLKEKAPASAIESKLATSRLKKDQNVHSDLWE